MKDNDGHKEQGNVRRALARGDARGLNAEDVLQALKNEGIGDLDAMAKQILESMRPAAGKPFGKAATAIDYELLLRPDPTGFDPTIVHRRPATPFILDGVSHGPEEISRFDGHPLYFVPTGRSPHDQKLVVFQDKTPLLQYVLRQAVASQLAPADYPLGEPIYCWGSRTDSMGYTTVFQYICGYKTPQPQPPQPQLPQPQPPPSPSATFFQHMHFTGNSFSMEQGQMYTDLTTLYRSGTSLFEDADWNDVISSIFLQRTTVWCYEHVGLRGSALVLGLGGFHPDTLEGYLESLGWNDRISSIICWSKIS